jgi:hypothetical protein
VTIVIQGHFVAFAVIDVLIWVWALIPRRRDIGFLNMRAPARLCAAAIASLALWFGYCVWRLWA